MALRMCVGLFLQEIKFKGPDESVRVCLRVCVCVRARCGRLAQGKECSLVFYDNRDFKEHYKQVHPRTRIPSGDQVRMCLRARACDVCVYVCMYLRGMCACIHHRKTRLVDY